LPANVDVFLRCPGLDMIFVLVVGHDEAGDWDNLMVSFLDYIGKVRENYKNPKVLLLASKWDTYSGKYKDDVVAFIKQNMPATHGRINAINGVVDYYTVGEVQKGEIVEFDPERAHSVKKWLYHAVTGYSLPGGTDGGGLFNKIFGMFGK
ncbi:MAG: hypothetical protein IT258_23080, partial [Saprospiraceae bacterium]|nr:hypothetical protein [Saprospiraceae bacterium]